MAILWGLPLHGLIHAKNKGNPSQYPKSAFIGLASWYGQRHQGRRMANGQKFDRRGLTAASRWLPLGSRIRVFNLENGRFVDVTVTDRGPSSRLRDRILDVSEAAATQLGFIGRGAAQVFVTPLPKTEVAQTDSVLEMEPTASAHD